ncbi:hypothetical protein SAMN04487969_104157 [Paenibacillus algorifonticola]|uniref:Uncharacterized protein n=1 Tax=Paenibacillus algorifonticola TaxID=684063 RepID=A0A1I2BZ17_9BACL|nr:hypothetical protein [Paenibacillus algorifonticola]SFE61138.1 hypothetical protein SAMN04487969_104157 [Paenibacillus algorifonticola]
MQTPPRRPGTSPYRPGQPTAARPTSAQTQRPVANPRVASAQATTAARQSVPPAAAQPAPQAASAANKKQPKNRLALAIISLIFGIISVLLCVGGLLSFIGTALDPYANDTAGMASVIISAVLIFIFSLLGFIFGLAAKRSSSGKGMAIAGIILSAPPLFLTVLGVGGVIFAGIFAMYSAPSFS